MLLVVATRNAHKTAEIAQMLPDWEVCDLSRFDQAPAVEETGTTFEQNASLKAISASRVIPGVLLADDSGLEVDAFGGKPGVWSSSFGGEEGNNEKNNQKLISELHALGKNESPARFRCVMVLAKDGKVLSSVSGCVEGKVIDVARGCEGFGYDPHFIPEGYEKTFSELGSGVKNQFSHRARALRLAVEELNKLTNS